MIRSRVESVRGIFGPDPVGPEPYTLDEIIEMNGWKKGGPASPAMEKLISTPEGLEFLLKAIGMKDCGAEVDKS